MKEFEFPGSYHVVEFQDSVTSLFIDAGTRKEIESAAMSGTKFVTIDDMYGIEFFIKIERIVMIHNTSPETRLTYRMHNQAIDREKRDLGPWDPTDG